jgi:hypothetical protein
METILEILRKVGGWHHGLYLKIDNPPYMELILKATDESGPCGLPVVSLAHYGLHNGDSMRDPEMCFELGLAGGPYLDPFIWRNDYVAVEQWSRNIVLDHYICLGNSTSSMCTSPRPGTPTSKRRAISPPFRTSASSASPLRRFLSSRMATNFVCRG